MAHLVKVSGATLAPISIVTGFAVLRVLALKAEAGSFELALAVFALIDEGLFFHITS